MEKYLLALNHMKKAAMVSNETIAAFIDYQLTPEQIQLILEGYQELLTPANLALIEKGLLQAYMQPIDKLKKKMLEIKINQSHK